MSILDYISLTPKQNIGGITIQATLEENYLDELQITEHPVEQGAAITDHAYKKPAEVTITCGWSNSNLDSLIGLAESLFSGGSVTATDYVSSVYSQLLALQESRVPFNITTSRRQYQNMLIRSLAVTVDKQTSNVLMVTATCRQIILVTTQATTLPPKENQANPQDTAAVENAGSRQATPATAAPGGAVSSEDW